MNITLYKNKDVISFILNFLSSQVLQGKVIYHNFEQFLLSCIYGHNNPRERLSQWNELRLLASNLDAPWAIMGDFNSILFNFQKSNRNVVTFLKLQDLRDCVFNCGLMDLHSLRLSYTWSNERVNYPILSKIDKFSYNIS